MLCGSWTEAKLVNSNKKGVLVSPKEVSSQGQGHKTYRCWQVGEIVDHRAFGNSCQELTFARVSAGCFVGCVLPLGGEYLINGPCRLLGQTKWMLRQQYHGVTLMS